LASRNVPDPSGERARGGWRDSKKRRERQDERADDCGDAHYSFLRSQSPSEDGR
jgi:hypothetical protein